MGKRAETGTKGRRKKNRKIEKKCYVPELWRDGIDNVPRRHAQHTEPELGPVRAMRGAAHLVQSSSCLDDARVLGIRSQQPHDDVVHRGAKDGALALDMQAPSAILVLAGVQIVLDFGAVGFRDGSVGHVPSDDDAGQEEHGAAVLARPVARWELQVREKLQAIACRIEGCACARELGEVLYLCSAQSIVLSFFHVPLYFSLSLPFPSYIYPSLGGMASNGILRTVDSPRWYLSAVL